MKKRIFSGVQPTSHLTIGNYLGAIRHWVPLQDEGECLFCIVDLHAITIFQDPVAFRQSSLQVAAAYLACGIDPAKSKVFLQHQVPAHTHLAWLLGCLTPMGWLNRMTQFKDKAGKDREKAGLGLYAYPVLMAADVLIYKATHVPVGEDQKQHLEMMRDLAGTFNHLYQQEYFPLPEPLIVEQASRIMSLRDGLKKMSKSDPSDFSRINLTDTPDMIAQKISKAKTDPLPLPETLQEAETRPEVLNLLTIYSALAGMTVEQVIAEFHGQMFSVFKKRLADLLISSLDPIRLKLEDFLKHPEFLTKILREGAQHAQGLAQPTVAEVQQIMGFAP